MNGAQQPERRPLVGRKLHLIAIGGVGMSALALVARELGATVSGSDRVESSYTRRVAAAGVTVSIGHAAEHVSPDAEVVVSTAIGEDNPELRVARERGQRVLHRADLLAELGARKSVRIAVAGTHGKTTTTAMIAHALHELGADPAYFVGGEVRVGNAVTNAHWGGGEIAVFEADESDGSFLKLAPTIAVVTNVELEHHKEWKGGLPELMAAFREFAGAARHAVLWRGQPQLASLADPARTTGFAIGESARVAAGDLIAEDLATPPGAEGGTSFSLDGHRVELAVRGEHNVRNALAALCALGVAGVPVSDAAKSLANFRGVGRRFECVGETAAGARVYDDYAHHPTEVRAALANARSVTTGAGRVVAVVEPHLYSRTRELFRELGRAAALADVAIVTDVYPSREQAADFPGVTGWRVATATADARPGMPVFWAPRLSDARAVLERELRPGDVCVTLGAGACTKLAHELVEAAA